MDIECVYTRRTMPDGEPRRMKYSQYKQRYADCATVPGTYDKGNKTIEVIIPEGRMKPSGVRGERFRTFYLMVGASPEKLFEQGFKAVSRANAIKQAKRSYAFVEE